LLNQGHFEHHAIGNATLVNWLRFLSDASVVSQRGNP